MRSPYSVIGATRGIDSDATVMPGSTLAPTTQPCDAELPGHEVYVVAEVTSHTVLWPFGLASWSALGAPLGPDTPVSAPTDDVPKRYPGRLWNARFTWMP